MVMVVSFRKGVSPVIATVLLLVLTIVIAGVLFSVVLPFVNDKLGKSKECLDALDGVEFPQSKFNCYASSGSTGETGFSIKINKDDISAVKLSLIDENDNSDVYEIREGTTNQNIRMVGSSGQYNEALSFPSSGGQRTYVTSKIYRKAEISAMTKSGEICSVSDTVEFQPCYEDVSL